MGHRKFPYSIAVEIQELSRNNFNSFTFSSTKFLQGQRGLRIRQADQSFNAGLIHCMGQSFGQKEIQQQGWKSQEVGCQLGPIPLMKLDRIKGQEQLGSCLGHVKKMGRGKGPVCRKYLNCMRVLGHLRLDHTRWKGSVKNTWTV